MKTTLNNSIDFEDITMMIALLTNEEIAQGKAAD